MSISHFIKTHKNTFFWLLFLLGLAFLIFVQYFGLVYYHYPVPPGHDAAMHWASARIFYDGQVELFSYIKSGAYPPGFYLVISNLAHLFNTDTLKVMLWLTPSIIIFSAVILFFLANKLFGKKAALISFFLYSFATNINIQQLNDGGYPNLIAAQILMPLLILTVFSINFNLRPLNYTFKIFISLIIFLLIPLTHHLSAIYLLGIAITMAPIIFIYFWIKNDWRWLKGLSYFIIIIIIIALGIFLLSRLDIFNSVRDLWQTAFQFTSSFPFIHIVGKADSQAIISSKQLAGYIGYSIFFFGCLGLLILPFAQAKLKNNKYLALLSIEVWAAILLIGSRLFFLSNPDRLARDAVFPLAILAGIFLSYLLDSFYKKKIYLIPILIIFLILTGFPLKNRIQNAFRYEPMVRITNADLAAINLLKQQPKASLLVEAYSFYFDYYLPDREIHYYWQPETYQATGSHALNPNSPEDLTNLKQYKYIYLVQNQQGWVPEGVKLGLAENYQNNPNFQQIGHFTSATNDIYLFKVLN